MKTKNLLAIIGAAAFTAVTININASDALLSPRAAGNQITRVSGVNNDPSLVTRAGCAVSPRAAGNQITRFAGVNNDVNPAAICSKMAGSPKTIAECASHPGAPMPCCAVATAN